MHRHRSTAGTRRRCHLVLLASAAVLTLAACGDGETASTPTAVEPTAPTSAPGADTTDAAAATTVTTTEPAAADTAAPTMSAAPGDTVTDPTPVEVDTITSVTPLPDLLGVPEIDVATTGTVGRHPVFSWTAVDGATEYQLSVVLADGTPLWAWSGATTSVALGGGDTAVPDDSPAAALTGAARWEVVATDGATVLAASMPTEVQP